MARRLKSRRTPKKKSSPVLTDVWPQERDFMTRPDRYKYVRKIVKPEGCVFCRAAESEAGFSTLCLLKTKHSMVVLNKYPYNTGHLLVIPQKHGGDLLALSTEEYGDLTRALRECVRIVKQAYQCQGLNVGLNHGDVAGAGLADHLHFHVVPRWFGDTNFFPLIAETKVLPETLEQSYERLLPYFSGL